MTDPKPATTGCTVIATSNPQRAGAWEGDFWTEPDGYRVHRKWVERFPHLYGPCAVDPDHGLGDVELDDALAKALAKIDGYGGAGSTSGERHCFQTAALIGYNYVESKDDIPPVPVFWLAEGHYWLSGVTTGRLVKKKNLAEAAELAMETIPGLLQNPETLKRVAAVAGTALAAGAVIVPPAITFVLNYFHITL